MCGVCVCVVSVAFHCGGVWFVCVVFHCGGVWFVWRVWPFTAVECGVCGLSLRWSVVCWCVDLCLHLLGANVHATTATGDTALTYACENGHTDVADVLLQAGADLVRALTLLHA